MNEPNQSPRHPGERTMQVRAGVAGRMTAVGRKVIRDFLPGQHRELFGKLAMLIVGAVPMNVARDIAVLPQLHERSAGFRPRGIARRRDD